MKYTEIFKLKEMLEKANIPFAFIEHKNYFSYGHEKDLPEISGLMTVKEEEETQDTVLGYHTAENVFERIIKHYQK